MCLERRDYVLGVEEGAVVEVNAAAELELQRERGGPLPGQRERRLNLAIGVDIDQRVRDRRRHRERIWIERIERRQPDRIDGAECDSKGRGHVRLTWRLRGKLKTRRGDG